MLDQWPASEDLHTVISSNGTTEVKVSGTITIYGDASGGKFTKYLSLRRIGVRLACIDHNGKLLWAIHCNLLGTVQTVARGQLFAVLRAAQLAEEGANIDFVTDNQGNYKKFNAGKERLCCLTMVICSNCCLKKSLLRI